KTPKRVFKSYCFSFIISPSSLSLPTLHHSKQSKVFSFSLSNKLFLTYSSNICGL
ncbi:hypothetical protein GIB67_009713, partial [Kingdonia uniflora]